MAVAAEDGVDERGADAGLGGLHVHVRIRKNRRKHRKQQPDGDEGKRCKEQKAKETIIRLKAAIEESP